MRHKPVYLLTGIIAAAILMIFGHATAMAEEDPPSPPASVVTLDFNDEKIRTVGARGLLRREAIRQAILIAARDGLGLATRDEALGEVMLRGGPGIISLREVVTGPERLRVVIKRFEGHGVSVVWDGQAASGGLLAPDLVTVIEEAEKLSRGTWVDALRRSEPTVRGPSSKAAVPATDPTQKEILPRQVREDLTQMDELAQYAAVRAIHKLIHDSGETPVRLSGLARGYANLGQLTAHHWSTDPKVFVARSLLYAQRLVATHGGYEAYWTRAYARALGGLHDLAVADLELAAKSGGAGPRAPYWVRVITPYCLYDIDALRAAATDHPPSARLATFLAYLTLEYSNSKGAITRVAKEAVVVDPYCMRLAASMCEHLDDGMMIAITKTAPAAYAADLSERLPTMPDLPTATAEEIRAHGQEMEAPQSRMDLCDRLTTASRWNAEWQAPLDRGEPSLACLASLIRETSFVHAVIGAYYVSERQRTDPSEYIDSIRPLIAIHPCRGMLEYYKANHETHELQKALGTPDVKDLVLPMSAMVLALRQTNPSLDAKLLHDFVSESDAVAGDAERLAWDRNANSEVRRTAMKTLQKVSSRSPVLAALVVHEDWNRAKSDAARIEADHLSHPGVLQELAEKLWDATPPEDTERCWAEYVALSPDEDGYIKLAETYWRHAKKELGIQALESLVKIEETYPTQHALIERRIAKYLTSQGDNERALQHAEACAEAGQHWGYELVLDAAEQANRWDRGEFWAKKYEDQFGRPGFWFEWCLRTGHGDLAAARENFRPAVEEMEQTDSREGIIAAGTFYVLTGDAKRGTALLERSCRRSGDPWAGLHVALLAQASGDVKLRDEMLQCISEKGPTAEAMGLGRRPELLQLAKLMGDAWKAKKEPNEDECERLVLQARRSPQEWANVCYFLGKFMVLQGNAHWADQWLTMATLSQITNTNRTLAFVELRALHAPMTKPAP